MENKLSTAILLAGGKSNRMGTAKGLLSLPGGKTWLGAQVDSLISIGLVETGLVTPGKPGLGPVTFFKEVIVVLGHGSENYLASVSELRLARTVINPTPERGQFSSLQAGIAAVETGDVFILPLDVPCPGQPVWRAVFEAHGPGVQAIMPVHEGRGGHPVLLARSFMKKLLAITPDSPDPDAARLDTQLHRLSEKELARVTVMDSRVTMNINTSVDWERFLAGVRLG